MKKVRAMVHPEAIESLNRYKDDLKAGHKAAAEYWRGQAGAYFTANPIRRPSLTKVIKGLRFALYEDNALSKDEAISIANKLKIRYSKVAIVRLKTGWFIYHYPQYIDNPSDIFSSHMLNVLKIMNLSKLGINTTKDKMFNFTDKQREEAFRRGIIL